MTGPIGRIRMDLARKIPVYPLPDNIQPLPAQGLDVNALWLIPENDTGKRIILFIHGGGYIAGSIRTHRELAGRIARATATRCLLPEYRLAPEHPFPAAIEDCISVYRRLIGQGVAAHNLVLVGDSAGGGLVASMLVCLRDNGTPLPSKAVLMAPWVDLSHDATNRWERLRVMAKAYLANKDPKLPLASPLYAKLHQLPPMMIQVSDGEPLYPQTVEFSKRVQACGGSVTLDVWKGLPHLWQYFSSVSQPGRTAIERIGSFIRKTAPAPTLPDTRTSSCGGAILPGGSRSAGPDVMA